MSNDYLRYLAAPWKTSATVKMLALGFMIALNRPQKHSQQTQQKAMAIGHAFRSELS